MVKDIDIVTKNCMCISLQNQSQLETLKSSLEDEIEYHKDQIDDHEVWCSGGDML